jgi:hypothetical protein
MNEALPNPAFQVCFKAHDQWATPLSTCELKNFVDFFEKSS